MAKHRTHSVEFKQQVLLGASQVDQYLTSGRYTDAAMAMLRQIRHSFGV